MQTKINIRKSFKSFIAHGGLILITILWVMPILWMLISTFRDPGQPYYFGLLPSRPTLVNFQKVLSEPINVWSLRNSAIVASATAVFVLLIACPAAYGFSRFDFTGKRSLQILLLVIRLFPASRPVILVMNF